MEPWVQQIAVPLVDVRPLAHVIDVAHGVPALTAQDAVSLVQQDVDL